MSIFVHLSEKICRIKMSRSGMSGSMDIHILIFDGCCQTAFKVFSQFSPLPSGYIFPYQLPSISMINLEMFCQSDRWKNIFVVLIYICWFEHQVSLFLLKWMSSSSLLHIHYWVVFPFYWVVESSLSTLTINLLVCNKCWKYFFLNLSFIL